MKKQFVIFFIFLTVGCVFSNKSFSQNQAKYSYITLTMRGKFDGGNEKSYLSLVTEEDNPNAAFIDSLVNYKPKLMKNRTAEFYYSKKDTSRIFFNYFRNRSECLQFLDEEGWELYHIFNDTDGNNNSISTRPVFYFRKENKNITTR